MIKILDTTLREGEQAAGVKFTLEQKVEIAKMLDDFGVDYIEAGMPAISEEDYDKVKAVADLGLNAEIVALARAKREDIDAVKETGAQWVGIFCGINERYSEVNLNGNSFGETVHMIHKALLYAKELDLKVKYTLEDASRTKPNLINELLYFITSNYRAIDLIDRLCFADTTGNELCGAHSPDFFFDFFKPTKFKTWETEAHFHNDLGIALANSLWVSYLNDNVTISCSLNGLGERAGITSLTEYCLYYSNIPKYKNKWKLSLLPKLSQKVAEYSGIKPDPLRPIIGKNAFTHTANLHKRAVKINPKCYEPFDPSIVGRERSFG